MLKNANREFKDNVNIDVSITILHQLLMLQ